MSACRRTCACRRDWRAARRYLRRVHCVIVRRRLKSTPEAPYEGTMMQAIKSAWGDYWRAVGAGDLAEAARQFERAQALAGAARATARISACRRETARVLGAVR